MSPNWHFRQTHAYDNCTYRISAKPHILKCMGVTGLIIGVAPTSTHLHFVYHGEGAFCGAHLSIRLSAIRLPFLDIMNKYAHHNKITY